MKIAVTYENGEIFQHFGHTEQFKLYQVENGRVVSSQILETNGSGHGALAGFLAQAGVDSLICGGIGGGARSALGEAGIQLYPGASGSADAAVEALLEGRLAYDPDTVCAHHNHEEGHSCSGHDHNCGNHNCGDPHKSAPKITKEQEAAVKALGFLRDKRTEDRFNGRVITRNGKISAEETRAIAEAAERFGSGEITMTARLTVEIQGVPYDNIEPLRVFLAERGLETGGTGAKVRPVVSCKGTTCQYGLIDTFALSEEIHQRFYKGYRDVKLPHKYKIAVGGCPNNCVKPDLNDIGIIGQRVPKVDLDKCRGCKVCQIERTCPIHVAKLVDGKIVIDESACNHCGRCVGKCPFGAFQEYTSGYRVCIGGRWGKKVAQGRYLGKIFTDEEEVLAVVEKSILLFRDQGVAGERFADTVARLGFENVEAQLLGDELLSRRAEILAEK